VIDNVINKVYWELTSSFRLKERMGDEGEEVLEWTH